MKLNKRFVIGVSTAMIPFIVELAVNYDYDFLEL